MLLPNPRTVQSWTVIPDSAVVVGAVISMPRAAVPAGSSLPTMTNASIDDLAVELVHWPRERQRREALAKAGVPRVLLVADGEVPPTRIGVGEDWIRVPADERDLFVRARRVSRHMAEAS